MTQTLTYINWLNQQAKAGADALADAILARLVDKQGPPLGREEGSPFDIIESAFDHTALDSPARQAYADWAEQSFEAFCLAWMQRKNPDITCDLALHAYYSLVLLKQKSLPQASVAFFKKNLLLFNCDQDRFISRFAQMDQPPLETFYLLLQNTRMAAIAPEQNLMAEWIESPKDDLNLLRFNSLILQHIAQVRLQALEADKVFDFICYCLGLQDDTIRKATVQPMMMTFASHADVADAEWFLQSMRPHLLSWLATDAPAKQLFDEVMYAMFQVGEKAEATFDAFEAEMLAAFEKQQQVGLDAACEHVDQDWDNEPIVPLLKGHIETISKSENLNDFAEQVEKLAA